ncbi:hypothetical protein M0J40_RS16825 [Providencia rettgeri]|nr:hypothetical protein [Providencia rettgeri]ELR5126926.1 hypothetical protein [Providencia rettgeri]ELR5246033.1 hypothetical protein [Providencia rettgeri]ELS4585117.1 hypothetical protein [Providencia rettgeri]
MKKFGLLNKEDPRRLLFYWRAIFYFLKINEKEFWGANVYSNIKNDIDFFLRENIKDHRERIELINHLNYLAIQNILPLSDFKWVFDNEEITSFVWGYLILERDIWNEDVIKRKESIDDKCKARNSYESLNLPMIDNGHHRKTEDIVLYFDSQYLDSEVINSIDILNQLKDMWAISNNIVKKFKWLNAKNGDSTKWAFDYIKKYNDKEFPNYNKDSGISPLSIFKPISNHEMEISIYNILKLWECHPSEKTLFIMNMNKAWQQRKLRHERTTKKAINCYVDIEVKNKLDELVKDSGFQMNYVLADLINRAHDIKFSKK